jgi:chromosome segregation ATPase
MNNLEQKYQKQVKDIQDSHRRIYTELINNNKELEKEIKSLRSENETNKGKKLSNSDYNKKLEEINEEKEKYRKLEEALKTEKENQIKEITEKYTKEKEDLKKKMADIEKNLREAEGKRGVLLLELEKEKAKWDIEKDNLQTKCQEYNDRIITLEKKNENLLRDNEKLKNEKYQLRTRGYKANDYKLGSHFGTTVGTKKFDYASSYNNAMISALDKNNKEDSKEKEKEISEKPSKVTPTSNNKTTTVNTGNKTIGTGNATKTVNERKEMTRKNK